MPFEGRILLTDVHAVCDQADPVTAAFALLTEKYSFASTLRLYTGADREGVVFSAMHRAGAADLGRIVSLGLKSKHFRHPFNGGELLNIRKVDEGHGSLLGTRDFRA
jgi:hypothetical protein